MDRIIKIVARFVSIEVVLCLLSACFIVITLAWDSIYRLKIGMKYLQSFRLNLSDTYGILQQLLLWQADVAHILSSCVQQRE
ncbi:hypothetical protein V2J09_009446 [Rumex salicifolius]